MLPLILNNNTNTNTTSSTLQTGTSYHTNPRSMEETLEGEGLSLGDVILGQARWVGQMNWYRQPYQNSFSGYNAVYRRDDKKQSEEQHSKDASKHHKFKV